MRSSRPTWPSEPVLEPFDVLVGDWDTEATHPQFDGAVPGSITLEDGVLRIWRAITPASTSYAATLGPDAQSSLRWPPTRGRST